MIIKRFINKALDKAFGNKMTSYTGVNIKRLDTLVNMTKKALTWLLYFIATMTALDIFGISTSKIAGAVGIGGLAIGFAAQSLVADVITGFFILLEDQYSIGDHVVIEGREGLVEELGIRVTKVRDFSGELYIIPNSNIKIVTNKARGPMRALVLATIAYEEDVDRAIEVLEKMCEGLKDLEGVIEGPQVVGITELAQYSVDIRIVAMCKPGDHWSIERRLRKEIKATLEENNIEIPYPRTVMINGLEEGEE